MAKVANVSGRKTLDPAGKCRRKISISRIKGDTDKLKFLAPPVGAQKERYTSV